MRWPWSKSEKRESSSYTDLVLAGIISTVSGEGAKASATAAVEAASGLVGRCFAAAEVKGGPEGVVTPEALAQIGRDLIRIGASIHVIDLDDGRLVLRPVGTWDLRGGVDPSQWMIRCDLFGPSGNETRFLPHSSVIHCRYATDPARPWCGISPLGWAALSGRLHASTVAALQNDMRAASASVIPMPPGENTESEDDDPLAGLKAAINRAKGKSVFVESTAGSFGGDIRDAPRQDWVQKRLGPQPDQTLAGMMDSTAMQIWSACGIPPALFDSKADGTTRRESYRQLTFTTLDPLGELVSEELSRKLDADIKLDFGRLHGADLATRGRALKQLVESGVQLEEAMNIVGLTGTE